MAHRYRLESELGEASSDLSFRQSCAGRRGRSRGLARGDNRKTNATHSKSCLANRLHQVQSTGCSATLNQCEEAGGESDDCKKRVELIDQRRTGCEWHMWPASAGFAG